MSYPLKPQKMPNMQLDRRIWNGIQALSGTAIYVDFNQGHPEGFPIEQWFFNRTILNDCMWYGHHVRHWIVKSYKHSEIERNRVYFKSCSGLFLWEPLMVIDVTKLYGGLSILFVIEMVSACCLLYSCKQLCKFKLSFL